MAYRSDLEAAHARVAALEQELATVRRRNAELEAAAEEAAAEEGKALVAIERDERALVEQRRRDRTLRALAVTGVGAAIGIAGQLASSSGNVALGALVIVFGVLYACRWW